MPPSGCSMQLPPKYVFMNIISPSLEYTTKKVLMNAFLLPIQSY